MSRRSSVYVHWHSNGYYTLPTDLRGREVTRISFTPCAAALSVSKHFRQ